MSETHALSREVLLHQELRMELKALYPEADEETLLDTLEGETDIVELCTAVLESAIQDDLLADACKARMEEIAARRDRLHERAEKKRRIVQKAMESTGRKKIEAPGFTVSLRPVAPSVIITAVEQIPARFMVQPEPPPKRPDKKAILDALKAGERIEGCTLSNGGTTISVRRK